MTEERAEWLLETDGIPPLDWEQDWLSYRQAVMKGSRRVVGLSSHPGEGELDQPGRAEGATLPGLAVIALYRRAAAGFPDRFSGRTGDASGDLLAVSEPLSRRSHETGKPLCSMSAGERLAGLLRGVERRQRSEFLQEWLQLVVRAGRLAPPEWIPDLLDLGRDGRAGERLEHRAVLRPLIREAVGPVGSWLSTLRPEWAWWSEDQESALPSDRANELARRTGELFPRLSSTLQLARGPNLPPRILLQDAPGADESGSGLSWIERSLGKIPLGYWTAHWGESPRDLVGAAVRSPHQGLLLRAWTEAAHLPAVSPAPIDPSLAQQELAEWIESLLHVRLGEPSEEGAELLSRLPEDRQDLLLLRSIALSHGIAVDQPAFWYMTRSTCAWSREVSHGLLRLLREEIPSRTVRTLWDWETLLRYAALRFDLGLLPEVETAFAGVTGIARSRSPFAPALATFLEDLRFRAAMRQEILERETE